MSIDDEFTGPAVDIKRECATPADENARNAAHAGRGHEPLRRYLPAAGKAAGELRGPGRKIACTAAEHSVQSRRVTASEAVKEAVEEAIRLMLAGRKWRELASIIDIRRYVKRDGEDKQYSRSWVGITLHKRKKLILKEVQRRKIDRSRP